VLICGNVREGTMYTSKTVLQWKYRKMKM